MITGLDFLEAGFIRMMDPQFMFTYDLSNPDIEYESEDKPALLWDGTMSAFCVTDGELMFIYFNAANPKEAIEWANKITSFEPN